MRRWLFLVAVLAGLLALAACAEEEKATPAPTASPAAAPAAWEQEWARTLEAAKREGKVVVAGPTGAERRKALTEPFERKYGITVEFQPFGGADFGTRLRAERDAGQYLWDIFVGGTTTQVSVLFPMGAMEPVEPALLLPEVKETKNWREGKLLFVKEKERMGVVMGIGSSEEMFVNSNLVNLAEFKSYRDLLDPKWKGKIVVGRDPRVAGPGQGSFQFFYVHPNLGPDFVRSLLKHDIAILADDRQALTWLAEGRYSIIIGVSESLIREFMDKGLPIKAVDVRQLREGSHVSPGASAVTLLNRAPHPNAAKVYLNWLLSKETQTEWSKAEQLASWRTDVPTDFLDPWIVPQPGYIHLYGEKEIDTKQAFLAFLKEVLGQ